MTLVARHAALTDVGLHRSGNEDSFAVQPPLFAVADGMGGAQAGEVASALALQTLVAKVADGDALAEAARAANEAVFEQAASDPGRSGMGTTLTALRLGDESAEVVQVGDSRLYRLRDGGFEQMTEDHSVVGEWVRAGSISPDEAHASRYRNVLTRALGTEAQVEVDEVAVELRAGDLLLLCSDGLSSMLTDDEISAVLARHAADVDLCARDLVHEAKIRGGHDNITVIVVALDEIGEREGETAAAAAGEVTTGESGDEQTTGNGDEAPAKGATATRWRPRGLVIVVLIAVALLLVGFVAGALVVNDMYFVGVDQGMVSVFRGAPYEVAGIKFYRVYLRSTVPIANVRPDLQQRINGRQITSKDAALQLVRQAQGISP